MGTRREYGKRRPARTSSDFVRVVALRLWIRLGEQAPVMSEAGTPAPVTLPYGGPDRDPDDGRIGGLVRCIRSGVVVEQCDGVKADNNGEMKTEITRGWV